MVRAMKKTPPAAPAPSAPSAPERWRMDAGEADVATLVIPADSFRTRSFEIDCRLVVAALGAGARHAMRVDVDGALEWTRQAAPRKAGANDPEDSPLPPGPPGRRPRPLRV